MVKANVDQKKCIGCGACAAIDPADWKLEGDKASLIGAKKEGKTVEEFYGLKEST